MFRGQTLLSVINYEILWRWLTTNTRTIHRYVGILLDEFADLQPKQEQMAALLQILLWSETRLVVTSASLQENDVTRFFGEDHAFVSVTSRKFTMQRCVVAPAESRQLLQVASHLAIQAKNVTSGPGKKCTR